MQNKYYWRFPAALVSSSPWTPFSFNLPPPHLSLRFCSFPWAIHWPSVGHRFLPSTPPTTMAIAPQHLPKIALGAPECERCAQLARIFATPLTLYRPRSSRMRALCPILNKLWHPSHTLLPQELQNSSAARMRALCLILKKL